MKQEIRVVLEHFSLYDFAGTMDEVIGNIHQRFHYYRLNDLCHHGFKFEVVGKEYEDGLDLAIVGYRLETDDEEQKRTETAERYKANCLTQYQLLKKEFGDSDN